MCLDVLPACMSRHHMQAWCLKRPEDDTESPVTELTGAFDLPCGCWTWNPNLLEEQQCS